MKKNLLISAIVIAIVVATVAISFAAWDIFRAQDNVTFNTGDNVALKVEKAVYNVTDKLVPENAIKQNANYKYEVIMAKDVELSITTSEGAADTVDYVWDLTKVTVTSDSTVINDVESFNKYFVIAMRPTDGNTNGSDDVALGGNLVINKKYDLVVKFRFDADAQDHKEGNNGKKWYYDTESDNEPIELDPTVAEQASDRYNPVMIDIYGDGSESLFNVSEFKMQNIALVITFEAVNQVSVA